MKFPLKFSTLAALSLAISSVSAETPPVPQTSSLIKIGVPPLDQMANNGVTGFIADQNEDQIVFYDNTTRQVTGFLDVGDNPYGVAVSGNTGVCANFASNSVSVFDVAAKKLVGEIPVGTNPINVALNGTIGLVTNLNRNTINRFDPTTLQLTGTLSMPTPRYVALSGTTALASGDSLSEVRVLNAGGAGISFVRTIPLSYTPQFVAISGTTGLTGDDNALRVDFLNTGTTTIAGSISWSQYSPYGAAIQGTTAVVSLYPTNTSRFPGIASIIDATNYTILGTVQVGLLPRAVSISGTSAYVYNDNNDNISIIDLSTRTLSGTISYPPYGIVPSQAMKVDGALGLASTQNTNSALVYDTATNSPLRLLNYPNGQCTGCALQGTLAALGIAPATLGGVQASQSYVGLFDASNGNLLGTVSTGFQMFDIALNGTLGVAAGNSNNLAFFNNQTFQLLGTVNAGAPSRGMSISGTTLAVAQPSGFVKLFDTTARTQVGTLTVPGTAPSAYWVDLKGTRGIVAPQQQNYVNFFETNPLQITKTLQLQNPAFWVASNGTVAIVSTGQGPNIPSVEFIDVQNMTSLGTVSSLLNTWGVGITDTKAFAAGNNDTGLQTFLLYPPLIEVAGNAGVSAGLINEAVATNRATPDLYEFYRETSGQSGVIQQGNLNLVTPGFKTIQYSLEKLDLLLHKELEGVLYGSQKGLVPFVMAGYDHLKQDRVSPYAGYDVDSYYQVLGLSHDWGNMKYLAAVGASESYMSLDSLNKYIEGADLPSEWYRSNKASYNTVYGVLGIAGGHKRWQYGLDGIFGYSFIHTKRYIAPFEASSHHGAWDISFDARLSYKMQKRFYSLMPYDSVGYLYGHENDYTENGAGGLNMTVKNENISVIRNALGLAFDTANSEAIKFFVDGSWVFDLYMNSQGYDAAFVDTGIYGTYHQTIPTKSYGRVHTGFKGVHKDFDWRLAYTGLFGSHFQENSVSVRFGYKF